ncbi:hypothetical protein [Aquimarina megaterium]|uniref:hypothetical protein n=1 Tax=Aquimarina megaterium TaxID=1443666 RepID=UPI0009422EF1|nr:hypothetical protein [Aquimarina megaterium]
MSWKWKEGSILNTYNKDTPCKDIFKAVCDEIAEYYVPKGWRYAKSRPKLTYNDKSIKIEIAFWSSGSNIPGDHVNLEIIPSFYSLELKKEMKSKQIDSNGYFLGFSDILLERLETIPKGTQRVINILGEINEFQKDYEETGILRYNHNINVYGITEIDFIKILDFIDNKILVWQSLIENVDMLISKVSRLPKSDVNNMIDGYFIEFIAHKFPDKVNDFKLLVN